MLLLPVQLVGKMWASILIHYFSSHPVAFEFQTCSPLDNIILNPASKKTDQSFWFSGWHLCSCSCHLVTEQLISHTRTVLVDTTASPQGSDGRVIPVSEVHKLLTNIYDILDSEVSNWVGNRVHILAYLFNSTSRQLCEVWALHVFPFFTILRTLFLLMKLAFMVTLTGLWLRLRLNNNLSLML